MFWLAIAAVAAEPAWTLDLGTSGAFPFLSDAGVLLVGTETEVLGIDVATGVVAWRRPQAECVRGDLFQPVPWTRYVLLSTYAAGPDAFEVVDAGTGVTAWTAPAGEVVMGLWPTADAAAVLVLSDDAEEPGRFALTEVRLPSGEVAWRVDDALRTPPPLVPARPGRTVAVTARSAPGPAVAGDAVTTAWSPVDGIVRRGPDGAVVWRLVSPGAQQALPADGFADLLVVRDTVWAPVRPDRLVALDAATGVPRWKPAAGHVHGWVGQIVPTGDLVVVAGGDTVEALDAATGRSAWRVRLTAAALHAVPAGDGVAVLDADGTLHGLGPDGTVRWALPIVGETAVRGLERVGDAIVVRLANGAVAVGSDGSPLWRVEQEGALPEPSPFTLAAGGDRAADLFREQAPDGHPARIEHVWTLVERVGGRHQVVLHRTDLTTGSDASVALGSEHPRWLWDPRTGTAVVLSAGGHLEGVRPAPPGGTEGNGGSL